MYSLLDSMSFSLAIIYKLPFVVVILEQPPTPHQKNPKQTNFEEDNLKERPVFIGSLL